MLDGKRKRQSSKTLGIQLLRDDDCSEATTMLLSTKEPLRSDNCRSDEATSRMNDVRYLFITFTISELIVFCLSVPPVCSGFESPVSND